MYIKSPKKFYDENNFITDDTILLKNNIFELLFNDNGIDNGVIAIDAAWGEGKTTFLKMLENEIKKEKADDALVVFYNAWENDYADDPFESLVGTLLQNEKIKNNSDALLDAAKSVAKNLTKGTVKQLDNMLLIPFLENVTTTMVATIKDAINKYNENTFTEALQKHKDRTKYVAEFKDKLKNLGKNGDTNPKKIIIIDELDRCNPKFSIKLLERIKHIFNTENTIFILGVNTIELSKSIKKEYGNDFSGSHYLQRFFDYHYLYTPDHNNLVRNYQNLFGVKFHLQLLFGVIDYFSPSTREIIKIMRNISLAQPDLGYCNAEDWGSSKGILDTSILYTLAALKIDNIQAFQNIDNADYILNRLSKLLHGNTIEYGKHQTGLYIHDLLNRFIEIFTINHKIVDMRKTVELTFLCLLYITSQKLSRAIITTELIEAVKKEFISLVLISDVAVDIEKGLSTVSMETFQNLKKHLNG